MVGVRQGLLQLLQLEEGGAPVRVQHRILRVCLQSERDALVLCDCCSLPRRTRRRIAMETRGARR